MSRLPITKMVWTFIRSARTWCAHSFKIDIEYSRTANLGRRLADRALKQGSDPDEARRARGEADFLTTRAVKLNSEEVKKLREQAIELLRPQGESSQSRN